MVVVSVSRTPEIEAVRSKLPAVLTEQEIVDAVRNNDFSIVCGDTGCGKSTQVPQFLYEAGFTEGEHSGKLIAVTQPRRVAAVAVSERVGVELNNAPLVGYQVRYDKKVDNEKMKIKFMTDGILLRVIQEDIRLPKYSVIVIDEAHERSINCDMLLGLLSGSVRARKAMGKPLRVVIMSATLRMTDFTENKMLFPNLNKSAPAVVQIDNRMHPVVVHYERRTEEEYVPLVTEKISKIHKTLPAGSILVFVTGKGEVHRICNSFREGYEDHAESSGSELGSDKEEDASRGEAVVVESMKRSKHDSEPLLEEDFNLGVKDCYTEELTFNRGSSAEPSVTEKSKKQIKEQKVQKEQTNPDITPFVGGGPGSRLRVFPLYAQMSSERQMEVFRASADFPEDRIVVVATNVAETSLTIPNVRFVIDSGREKRKEFNSNGVSRFAIRFTSKAGANQRAGRAGRVGPGHVYRLYSPNVFGEHMSEFPAAEIETNPLDSAILFLRSMGVPSASKFPWPSPPPALHLEAAVKRLKAVGAMSFDENITEVGKQVSNFPVAPRLAVALIQLLRRTDVMSKGSVAVLLIAGIAMMSVECLSDSLDPEIQKSREITISKYGDDIELITNGFVDWFTCSSKEKKLKLCEERGLNPKAMEEARSLFFLLCSQCKRLKEWKSVVAEWDGRPDLTLTGCKDIKKLQRFLRECLTHSFVDQIAAREEAGSRTYRAPGCSDPVHIMRFSACYRLRPQLLAYSDMQQSSTSDRRSMRVCFPVDAEYLATIESPLIDRTKPHPMMRPTMLKNGRKIAFVVPRYTPLSMTIVECIKVEASD
jgi:ATP-dependent RNA helicase DHX37/DHR1